MFRTRKPVIAAAKILCVALSIWSLLLLQTASAQESRTWVDATGEFRIEASFESLKDGKVMLKLPDGKLKQIPLSMLSDADKTFIDNLNSPAPVESPKEVPTPEEKLPETPAVQPKPELPATTPEIPEPPREENSTESMTTAPAPAPSDSDASATADEEDTSTDLPDNFARPDPIIITGKEIGDLDMDKIEPPQVSDGPRANPKYLLPVEQSELILIPRNFQGAAQRLLNESESPRDAVMALEYLKLNWPENRQPTLIKLVVNCASSDEKYNRETALEILADRDSDQSFPYILARVDDTSFTVRSKAFEILRKLGDRRAIPTLAKRFTSSDSDRVASLLRYFGTDAEPVVLPFLSHEDPEVRLRACSLIGNIGTGESLQALEEMAGRETTMMLKAQTRSSLRKVRKRVEQQQ